LKIILYENKSFDLVYLSYVPDYLNNKAKALSKMKRVLKNGVLITIIPS